MDKYQTLTNRLIKNFKHLRKTFQRSQTNVFRVYDKDIPEFPFAIDKYDNHLHIQEYDTGWQISDEEYQQWQNNCIQAACTALETTPENTHWKKRIRQRKDAQYEKTGDMGKDFVVEENGLLFWVNLDKYLDTGLFIDHRDTRQQIRFQATNKSFLNLFAYTGSFSIYAAAGGAKYTETVDLSNTYLDWAKRNFKLNHINLDNHIFIRSDVFIYLKQAKQQNKRFDLIVMDPPSFSNSKKMDGILDVQKNHAQLIDAAMSILNKQGKLYFSNNLRSFSLDEKLSQRYKVKNISDSSIPKDFRNRKIHYCFVIEHI